MPLPKATLEPLTKRFQGAVLSIGESSAPRLKTIWTNLGSYDEAQIAKFEHQSSTLMVAAKRAAVSKAAGYYSLAANVRPVPVSINDVSIAANMREPFIATWSSLKNGSTYEDAVAAGANRTDAVMRNFVVSSARMTGDIVAGKSNLPIVGWERIPDANACAWCLDVANAVYESSEAADFGHDRCGCAAQPIFAEGGQEPTTPKGPLRHETNKDGVAWAENHWGNGSDLPTNQRDAIANYGKTDFTRINGELRARKLSAQTKTQVSAMDKGLAAHPVPEDVIVHRGTHASSFGKLINSKSAAGENLDSIVGKTFVERSYQSTSVGAKAPGRFGDFQVQLELTVPKGTPGHYIGNFGHGHKAERELLLGRNLRYRVDSVVQKRGFPPKFIVKATVIS